MRDKRNIFTWAYRGVVEYALLFPILALLCIYLIPDAANALTWFLLFPACLFIGAVAKGVLRWKRDNLWLVLLMIPWMVVMALSGTISLPRVLLFLIGYVLFVRGVQMMSTSPMWSGGMQWHWISLAVYFVVFAISSIRPEIQTYQTHLLVGGMWALVTTLFTMNRGILHRANITYDDSVQLPKEVVRRNQIYVIGIVTIVFLFVAVTFGNLMDSFMRFLRQAIAWLLRRPAPEEQVAPEQPVPPPSMPQLDLGDAGKPNRFLKWLEQVFTYLFWTALVIAIIVLLWFGLRYALKKLFPKLWHSIQQFLKRKQDFSPSSGYEDEQSSLFKWDKIQRQMTQPWDRLIHRFRRHEVRYDELTNNRDRIRYLYRQCIMQEITKGFPWQSGSTPQETLKQVEEWETKLNAADLEDLARAYNEARYSDSDLSNERVEFIIQQTLRKKH
jgi:hypothetical protein